MNTFIFQGKILHAANPQQIELFLDGALVIEKGKIQFCDDAAKLPKKFQNIRSRHKLNGLIIPGLIDTHIHLPQMNCRNKFKGTLLPWLKNHIWPEEAKFKNPKYARNIAKLFFQELIKNGTTSAAVYLTIHPKASDIAFQEAKKAGLRLIMGKVMMDQNSPLELTEKTAQSLQESLKLCQKWHGHNNLLFYAFTPRFAPTCSDKLLKEIGNYARKTKAYIQTHLSENKAELTWVKKLFPQNKNYTDVYKKAGLLTPKTILAHCIHLSKSEISELQKSRVNIAYCPTSNAYLKSGRMPLEKMKKLKIGLGTDVGAGPTFSLFEVMKQDAKIQKKYRQKPEELFYQATLGGAKALGFEKITGNFQKNKDADFIEIKLPKKYRTSKEILKYIIQHCSSKEVQKVFVRGKKLL